MSRRNNRHKLKAKTQFAKEVATGERPNQPLKGRLPKRLRKPADYQEPSHELPGIVKIPLDEIKRRMEEEMIETQPMGRYEDLRHLTDTYMQVQKLRIANFNRSYAATDGADLTIPEPFVVEIVEDLEALERKIFRQMKRTVKDHPAWEWLDGVKGMGPTLSTKVLGMIADIGKFPSVSHLWSFSGYGLTPVAPIYDETVDYNTGDRFVAPNGSAYKVVEKQRQVTRVTRPDDWPRLRDHRFNAARYTMECLGAGFVRQVPVKGQKLSYNRRLKTALYLCGDSFIKSRSPYRDIYDEAKVYYRDGKQIQPLIRLLDLSDEPEELMVLRETPDGKNEWDKLIKEANKKVGEDQAVWSDGHVDNAARRKMVKRFLSHLWLVWREAEGLPVSDPYVIASPSHPEHSHIDDPWSYSG